MENLILSIIYFLSRSKTLPVKVMNCVKLTKVALCYVYACVCVCVFMYSNDPAQPAKEESFVEVV